MSLYSGFPPPALGSTSGCHKNEDDDFDFGLSLDAASTTSISSPPSSSTSSWAKTMGGTFQSTPPSSLTGLVSSSSKDDDDFGLIDIDGGDDCLDDSRHNRDLVEKILREGGGGGGDAAASAEAGGGRRMRHSASMPEMVEVCAMRDFNDAMCAMKQQGIDADGADGDQEVPTRSEEGGNERRDRDEEGAPSSPSVANKTLQRVGPKQDMPASAVSGGSTNMRRSQSFAGFSGYTGLSQMARFNSSASSGFSPCFGTIDEKAPIMWKRHDPRAVPRRSSIKHRSGSMTSLASTVSLASASSDDADEGVGGVSKSSPVVKRNVSFSSLEIFEHEMTLGDNPSVTAGPPVTLEWRPHTYESHDLEEYEEARADLRRNRGQMQMSDNVRFFRLMREKGFTAVQIKRAVDEVQKAKQKRMDTITGLRSARLEEALESAERKVKRFFKVGKRSNKV